MQVAPGSEDHAAFEFALYEWNSTTSAITTPPDALARGNAIMQARTRHDAGAESRLIEQLIRIVRHRRGLAYR